MAEQTQEEVLHVVLQSAELPTLSNVASRLITITSQEDTTINDIASLISKDVSLSTKLLRVVNSAFYSFPQQIGTIHQAASILGTNAVRSLVLSFSFLKPEQTKSTTFDYAQFWENSLFEAVTARMLMTAIKTEDAEEGFIASLLQNLGTMILARAFPAQFLKVENMLEVADSTTKLTDLEKQIIGADHTYIGSEIVKKWGFPETLIAPIEYHHAPHKYPGESKKIKLLCQVVHLSDMLSKARRSKSPEEHVIEFRKRAKQKLGLSDSMLEKLLDKVHTEVEETAKFFNLKIAPQKSIAEILQIANAELSVLNLSYEQMNRSLVEKTVKLELLTKELEKKNEFLEKLANIDGLTEAYNHRFFQIFLDKEIKRADRNESNISVIMIDIDNFKPFNDRYGHQIGDQVLIQFSKLFRDSIREYDLFARYGGEEFILILPDTALKQAGEVAEKLCTMIAGHTFTHEYENYHITASFGVASINPAADDFGKNELISRADNALYESKKKGRNAVTIHCGKKKWFGR
ncbi:MAG: GGDEF domain-containing protein [Desulfuromonadaceae bacterium]|nr:GGDEF domain-containing protein [Desulfuromonadaceae bacterium]